MKTRNAWNLWFVILSCATLLSACQTKLIPEDHSITLKNQRVCFVAGVMAAGMNCANTLEGDPYEMDIAETMKFLEPSVEENRSGAACMPAEDFNDMKTTIDIACKKAGAFCTAEIKQKIASVTNRIESVQHKTQEVPMYYISSIPMQGDVSDNTKVLQKALNAKGFGPLGEDGIYGAKTNAAVIKAQKSFGLTGGGIIGPKTLEGLGIQVRPVSPATGSGPITHDLKGRKARYLHPTLRILIEAKVFPEGQVPRCFWEKDLPNCVVLVAEAMESLDIREVGGNNRGPMVGLIQGVIGTYAANGTGDAWCMSTDQCIIAFIEDYFQVESPVLDSEHCVTTHNAAKKVAGLIAPSCQPGTFWIAQHGETTNGHTGTVLANLGGGKMSTFEGNTGDASMRDGDGAYFRTRDQKKNGDLKTLSFVYVYPNNKVPQAA